MPTHLQLTNGVGEDEDLSDWLKVKALQPQTTVTVPNSLFTSGGNAPPTTTTVTTTIGGPPQNYTIVYANVADPAHTNDVVPITLAGWWDETSFVTKGRRPTRKPRTKRPKVQAVQTRRALALGGLPEK